MLYSVNLGDLFVAFFDCIGTGSRFLNVLLPDKKGVTAQVHAERAGHTEIVEKLMAYQGS